MMTAFEHLSNRNDLADTFISVLQKKELERNKMAKEQAILAEKNQTDNLKQIKAGRTQREEELTKLLNKAGNRIEELEEMKTTMKEKKDKKIDELKTSLKISTDQVTDLVKIVKQMNKKINSLESAATEKEQAKLDVVNDLLVNWHEMIVAILNSSSKTSVDMGKGELSSPINQI